MASLIHERREAEEALLQEKYFTQSILHASPSLTYVFDISTGKNVFASNKIAEVLGYTAREILNMGSEVLPFLLHPDDIGPSQERFAKLLHADDAEVFELTYRMRNKKGEYVWMYDRARLLKRNSDGSAAQILGVVSDITSRKELEEKTMQQFEELEAIYRTAPVGLGLIDTELRYTRINQKLADMNGISVADHLGKTVREVVPDLADQVETLFRQILETGMPIHDIEVVGKTPAQSNEERIWSESWYPIFDREGKAFAVSLVVEEITDRKRAEEALRQSEEQMRFVLEASKIGMWIVDLSTQQVTWSAQNYTIYGITRFGCTMEHFRQLIHPDDVAAVWMNFMEAIEEGKRFIEEYRTICPDGSIRWVGNYGQCDYNQQGQPVRFLGTAQDITHRKLAEQSLRESESRFRNLAETLPVLVWMRSADGSETYGSRSFREYAQSDDLQAGWYNMMHPEDQPSVMAEWELHYQTLQPFRREVRLRHPSGEYRWHYSAADPINRADGKLLKWVGSLTDIHTHKTFLENLEQQVQERTRELKRSNEDLQQFAHVASHDLKEPVRKVLTFSNLIASQFSGQLPEHAAIYLEKINAAARHSYEMIEGVLRYSQVGSADVKAEEVSLAGIIQNVVADLEIVIGKKQAVLQYQEFPVLQGYGPLLYQLFYNLISNALKFSNEGIAPIIEISCSRVEGSDLTQLSLSAGSYHCISIKDNGIGFQQQFARHIFQTFHRLNARHEYEGTGIGLALCKRIVLRHGGDIAAFSEEGKGAIFLVYLPVQLAPVK